MLAAGRAPHPDATHRDDHPAQQRAFVGRLQDHHRSVPSAHGTRTSDAGPRRVRSRPTARATQVARQGIVGAKQTVGNRDVVALSRHATAFAEGSMPTASKPSFAAVRPRRRRHCRRPGSLLGTAGSAPGSTLVLRRQFTDHRGVGVDALVDSPNTRRTCPVGSAIVSAPRPQPRSTSGAPLARKALADQRVLRQCQAREAVAVVAAWGAACNDRLDRGGHWNAPAGRGAYRTAPSERRCACWPKCRDFRMTLRVRFRSDARAGNGDADAGTA
jgi:hypothetical protein